jgi:hypothetical protein
MTDHPTMDSQHHNPSPPKPTAQGAEPTLNTQPTPTASSIESLFPTADANRLLELISQGHDPANLNHLINHSNSHNRAA